jgi:hypothetical protein
MTIFTTMSALTNMPHGDRSRGRATAATDRAPPEDDGAAPAEEDVVEGDPGIASTAGADIEGAFVAGAGEAAGPEADGAGCGGGNGDAGGAAPGVCASAAKATVAAVTIPSTSAMGRERCNILVDMLNS